MSDYPQHLVKQVRLRNGTRVTLRPIRPEDAQIESEFVRGLSDEARYNRFMDMLRELSPSMLRHLTRIDYQDHMAFIAVTRKGRHEAEIGVARYVVNPDGKSCEFAIVVGDDWHGTGVAKLLMEELFCAARARGLESMVGEVLCSNHRMLHFVHRLGFALKRREDDPTVMCVTKSLQPPVRGSAPIPR